MELLNDDDGVMKDDSSTGPGNAVSHSVARSSSMATSATGDFMSEMAHRLKERRAKAVSEARFSLSLSRAT